jgi:hypothetical protein
VKSASTAKVDLDASDGAMVLVAKGILGLAHRAIVEPQDAKHVVRHIAAHV